jgi:hypothetical protein
MIATSPTTLARVAGVVLGAGLAAFVLIAARPSANVSRLSASVRFSLPVTGELEVTPAPPRPVMAARALTPGARRAAASFSVRNQTGATLAVGFRARAAVRDLDGLLRIRLTTGGRTLADTTLQGLRHGSVSGVRLRPGAQRRVGVQAWIPNGIGDGYEGRSVAVELTPMLTVER